MNLKKKRIHRITLLAVVLMTAMSAKSQDFAIDPSQPVSVADVEVTAVNYAFFDNDSIHVVSPDKVGPARARRRVSANELQSEGWADGPSAKLYSYNYPSVDADGNKVTLSSLMAVPTMMVIDGVAAKPNNLIIGCHVTITSNYECPTEYNRTGGVLSWMTDVGMQIFYTRYDFVRQPCCLVILPDYEGYGVSRNRAHPYLYQELTARQVVDGVRYGLALFKANVDNDDGANLARFEDNWKSVCVGYSQGGSVALATHRFIEQNGLSSELHFAGSVCGDGPYDPIEHLRYYMQDNGETYDGTNKTEHQKETVSMPIVMPLILKGMCDRNPFMRQHKVSDYLSEKFLRTGVIDFINAKSQGKDDQYSTDRINTSFKNMRKNGLEYVYTDENGNPQKGSYSAAEMQTMLYRESNDNVHGKLSEMLTQQAFDYFRSLTQGATTPSGRGVMEDLHRALASNSLVSGWTPTHRIGFYHSTYDTVVPYANLLSFIRNQNGLSYYFHSRDRSTAAGVNPSHIVGEEGQADVYIFDDDCKKDHVDGGKEFFFFGSPSPDYRLIKWVLEGKK
jgi:hypothetical protein